MEGFPLQFQAQSAEHDGAGSTLLVVDIGQPHEAQEVYDFLQRYVVPCPCDGDAVAAGGSSEEEEDDGEQLWMLDLVQESLSKPYTMLVRDKGADDQLVAVQVNMMQDRRKMVSSADPNSASWLPRSFLASLSCNVDLFSLHQAECVLGFFLISVNDHYGRLGLASSKVLQLSIDLFKAGLEQTFETEPIRKYVAKTLPKFSSDSFRTMGYIPYEMNQWSMCSRIDYLDNRPELLTARRR